jgi:hypothetical protein
MIKMKTIVVFCFVLFSLGARSQDSLQLARLRSLQNKNGSFASFAKKDSLILICFWATSSEESISELNTINVNLENWQKIKPFRFMAVSTDDGKTAGRMRPIYNMNGWTFDSYADIDGDLRRALHSNNLPQSMILYKGQIIYEQNGWTAGSENYLLQRILSVK